ncbi:energy transducer TonB [Hirschia maritima]|uniref:energy transducer TonB n=1 Tax=Hirschia maritima TaxID=1121961 RepID=UPI0003825C84|nr:energy transducer TonB [Hirschia maritima]
MKKTNLFAAFAVLASSTMAVLPASAEQGLKAIQQDAPVYPAKAEKREIEGSVELAFVVLKDGTVDAVEVVNSTRPEMFDAAAVEAVSEWKFEKGEADENVGVVINFEF